MSGRFLCFEGLDGAGKTTAAIGLTRALAQAGVDVHLVERKDARFPTPELSDRMAQLRRLIWEYGDLPLAEYGDHHALYNMASWFAVLDRCKVRPLLARGSWVVADNWWHKFAARFIVKPGADRAHIERCFAQTARPDAVIFLDISPPVAGRRKQSFSRGECGNFDGLTGLTRDSFVSYQERVRGTLLDFARAREWIVIQVDRLDEAGLLDAVLASLRERDLIPRR